MRLEEQNLYDRAKKLLENEKTFDEIKTELSSSNSDSEMVIRIVDKLKEDHYNERNKRGIPFLALGACLCLIGCMFALLSSQSSGLNIGLYGFTSLGAIFLVLGLYFIFN